MNGLIAGLIGSTDQQDIQTVMNVFAPGFQNMGQWRSYLRVKLGTNVAARLRASAATWTTESFHALFIACWVHHPVEKGSFMLDLSLLTPAQRDVVEAAYMKHLYSRKSSHLSGTGRSASRGWAFLNGYHELLVQYETTMGRTYLFLKAEGHTTKTSDLLPHLKSWVHKKKTGAGLTASVALRDLASESPQIEGRAAENYGKGYKDLLKKVLKFHGKKVTVREAAKALFKKVGYTRYSEVAVINMTNLQLGDALLQYIAESSHVGAGGLRFRAGGAVNQEMINDLRKLAQSLRSDGDVHVSRVYRELRLMPADVDQSLDVFYAAPGV
jgi:hypothetical protein